MFRTNSIIVLVILSVVAGAISLVYAKELRVFSVEQAASGDGETFVTDYYLNEGSKEGIKKGDFFNVYRLKLVKDPFARENNKIKMLLGQIKVIKVHEKISIARLDSLEKIKSSPISGLQAVMIGDVLKAAPKPKPKKKSLAAQASSQKPSIIISSNIMFDLNSWQIKPQASSALLKVAEMISSPKDTLIVEGFTCNIGKKENNLRLSRKRAESVATFVRNLKKIPKKQIIAIGYGDDMPIASNKTEEGRAKNRRVEFKIIPSNQVVFKK